MLWYTAILIGFLGSFHCLGMCAPIVWALPKTSGGKVKWLANRLLYNAGRVITYAFLGSIMGLVGRLAFKTGFQQWISIIIGLLLVLGVLVFKGKIPEIPVFGPVKKSVAWLKNKMGRLLRKRSSMATLLLGTLNGLLPCGLVYAALIASIVTGSAIGGAFYMVLFGLGTFPMMMAVAWMGQMVSQRIKNKVAWLTPRLVFIVGLLFVLRGMNLGIPLLSPVFLHEEGITTCKTTVDPFTKFE